MPIIRITDQFGVDIDSVTAVPKPDLSAFAKYCRTPSPRIVLPESITSILDRPLSTLKQTSVSLGLKFADKVDFGTAQPEITIKADVKQTITILAQTDASLAAGELFGSPPEVGDGNAYVSLALNGSFGGSLPETQGNLSFGFHAGATFGAEYWRRFAVNATSPTLAQALSEVISGFVIAADVSDFDGMQPGDITTVSGNGEIKVTGDVTISASANPLASPKLPLVSEAVDLQAGGSIDIGASFELSGSYQIRVRKLADDTVEIAWYRKRGEEWTVSAQASAGVGLVFEKTDLLEKLIAAVSGNPEADINQLRTGGLGDDEIKEIQAHIARSVEHSLKASLDVELSASDAGEAAFLYRVNTSGLDAVSLAAVHAALRGNLSALTALEKNDDGHGAIASGVTMLRSCFRNIRDRKVSLRINLLGLMNFSSLFELIQKSQVLYEPVTGNLTIHETVSGTRIETLMLPEAQEKLRKIQFDSLLVTTAYRAGEALKSMDIASACVHFAFNDNTNRQTMADYLDSALGLGLIDEAGKARMLSEFQVGGPSTCQLQVTFGNAACEGMFLKGGQPRTQADYEAIARRVWRTLIQEDYRKAILSDDTLWKRLKEKGQPGFGEVLPALAADSLRLGLVRGDYTVIMWWAESMASTARKLADMKAFVRDADPDTLHENSTFKSKRSDLQNHLAGVVATSGLKFGLPFGLVALYQAAAAQAMAGGIIVSNGRTRCLAPALAAT